MPLFGPPRTPLVSFSYPYLVLDTPHWSAYLVHVTTLVINSTTSFVLASFVSMSEEESPTRYMLPEQAEIYPIATKKKRKKKDNKDNVKAGISVQFHDKVTLLTIHHTLNNHLEELELANEDDYPTRVSAFALKRNNQKQILKYQHQYRPLTPRRLVMLNHVRKTLLRENGNPSSSTPQTQTSTQTLSSSPSPS